MYTLTEPPKHRLFTTPNNNNNNNNNSRPKSQQPTTTTSHSATHWKTSSTHRQKPVESWKTSSPSLVAASYQQPQLNPHDPSHHLHRHSMPVVWSSGYDQGRHSYHNYNHHHYQQIHGSINPSANLPKGGTEYYQQFQPEPKTPTCTTVTASTSPTIHHQSMQPRPTASSLNIASQQITENTKRQITVKSVNAGNRVWIDVLMTDTGASLAAKIHRIATFGTRKIIAITTAQGQTVPLDRRPIFGGKHGVDMAQVEHGDYWPVEWVALDPSLLNKVLSKLIK